MSNNTTSGKVRRLLAAASGSDALLILWLYGVALGALLTELAHHL